MGCFPMGYFPIRVRRKPTLGPDYENESDGEDDTPARWFQPQA
jgi:hypothetical protein